LECAYDFGLPVQATKDPAGVFSVKSEPIQSPLTQRTGVAHFLKWLIFSFELTIKAQSAKHGHGMSENCACQRV
jgi:hypothetical protein